MDELSWDEMGVLIASVFLSAIMGLRYLGAIVNRGPFLRTPGNRLFLVLTPAFCLLLIFVLLTHWTDSAVRNHANYITLFMVAGLAWLLLAVTVMPVVGISVKADGLERSNPAASTLGCGVMVGVALCYAGGNIGNGSTIWMTFGPAALATATLFILWFVIEALGGVADAVTIDRDLASAWRLAGSVVAMGAILGRAVAGNYVSVSATLHDFARQGWPSLVLAVATATLHRLWRPTPSQPKRPIWPYGVRPAIAFGAFSAGWVLFLGWWK